MPTRQSGAHPDGHARRSARRGRGDWLVDGVYVLEVHPFPEYGRGDATSDRSSCPRPASRPRCRFAELQRADALQRSRADPGRAARDRRSSDFNLLVDAGYAADQRAAPGTAQLAMNMLDEGTASRSALEISDRAALLGAELGAGSNLDMSTVSLSALKENLDASLELFADVILNPSFPEKEFDRAQEAAAGRASRREKTTPLQMALRVFPGSALRRGPRLRHAVHRLGNRGVGVRA